MLSWGRANRDIVIVLIILKFKIPKLFNDLYDFFSKDKANQYSQTLPQTTFNEDLTAIGKKHSEYMTNREITREIVIIIILIRKAHAKKSEYERTTLIDEKNFDVIMEGLNCTPRDNHYIAGYFKKINHLSTR